MKTTTRRASKITPIILLGMMMLSFASCGQKIVHKTITVGTEPCPESDFTFVLNDDGNSVSITSYTGHREDLVFPKTIQGLPVTKIKKVDGVCGKNKNSSDVYSWEVVTSVYIPEGIKEIEEKAFSSFYKLNKIVMKGVTKIGKEAFKAVGYNYYQNDDGKIVCSSTYIWNNEKNRWDDANYDYFSVDSYPTIEFSENLVEIDESAFASSGFRNIDIPASLKVIGNSVFAKSSLKEVKLNEGLVAIDANAFLECNLLEKINFPSSLKVISAYAFCNTNLKEVKLNEGLEFLGIYAFNNCEELTSVSLSSSLKYVAIDPSDLVYIFKGDKISDIIIPNNFNPKIVNMDDYGNIDGTSYDKESQKVEKLFAIPDSTLQNSLQLQKTLSKKIRYATNPEGDKAYSDYHLYVHGKKVKREYIDMF